MDEDETFLALERVVVLAREHLAAILTGRSAEEIHDAYVALNNASVEYDELLLERFGAVTPWEVDWLDRVGPEQPLLEPDASEQTSGGRCLSVRARYDYCVTSPEALFQAVARAAGTVDEGRGAAVPPDSVGEAVYELVHSRGQPFTALDCPGLQVLGGFLLVHAVGDTDDTITAEKLGPGTDYNELLHVDPESDALYQLDEVFAPPS